VIFFKCSAILNIKWPFGVFEPSFLGGGLRGNIYDVHLRLIGKRVVDFVLVIIQLFRRCYGNARV